MRLIGKHRSLPLLKTAAHSVTILCAVKEAGQKGQKPMSEAEKGNDKQAGEKSARPAIIAGAILIVILAAIAAGAFWYLQTNSDNGRGIPFDKFKLDRKKFTDLSPGAKEAFDITVLHSDSKTEWWYVNSHLIDVKNNRYTLMLTFLKPAHIYGLLAKVNSAESFPITSLELLKTDEEKRTYAGDQFTLTQPDPDYLCYKLASTHPAGEIDLEFCANKPPLEVGGDGTIKMGKKGESFYYSLTNMNVEGSISLLGGKPIKVRGRGWMDRQWGNWRTEDFDTWKWWSIQLFDDTEVMFFNFIRDGRNISPVGEIVHPDGTAEHNLLFRIKTLDNWVSERTGVSWSSGWEIKVMRRDIKFTIIPDFPNQEINEALWEGGCSVEGVLDGRQVYGRAFYEERRKTWEDRKRDLMKQGKVF